MITGSSSGFGRSLVEAVLKKGDRVVATARKPEQLDDLVQQYQETVHAVRLDVTNLQDVEAAIKSALNQYDRIDVLVNNAGYPAMGAIEELSDDDTRRQFETNKRILEILQRILSLYLFMQLVKMTNTKSRCRI